MIELKKSGIPIQVSNKCLVSSIQIDLDEALLNVYRDELLQFCAKINPSGIVLDLSGLRIIDYHDFNNLKRIIDCAKIMGYATVLSGIKPEVVASLMEFNANTKGILCTRNMDEAFLILNENSLKDELTSENENSENNTGDNGENIN